MPYFPTGTRLQPKSPLFPYTTLFRSYQALLALLQKPGEIVTREELRMQLWPSDTHVNYDANVNTTVNKLRQVLGDSPDQPAFVDTIPRKGYSFVGKVRYVDHPVAPQAPRPEELSPRTTDVVRAEGSASFFRTAILSKWFTDRKSVV